MILLPLTEELALTVASAMRAADAAEIYATRWSEDPRPVAASVAALSRFGFVVATDAGRPAAAMGAAEAWPGMWSVWMFATDDWPQVALGATQAVKRLLIPAIVAAGAHRAECRSLISHKVAHRWLEYLGARREAVLTGYGRCQEDFIVYSWRRSDVPGQAVRT